MKLTIMDNLDLNVSGKVTVREIFPDGDIKIKRKDENVVVYGGILLLLRYITDSGADKPLSGITHFAVGSGKPDFIDSAKNSSDINAMLYGLESLQNETLRVVRWDVKYWKEDEGKNLKESSEPTNIIDFIYRLRQREPAEKIYISEIGMFSGNVQINDVPYATIDNVKNKGIMFSYRYYDPPIDKAPETILEFAWRITLAKR